ncbi:hypothetical protein SISSUDRAFT_664056 [Sistotremastrum suecicum HHB10207 ss-3]|uniref:Uncharacterized protein n=1 Tax=Sistotremastrum suecicum HHB10207 ss-3 TaxID=1314776 RepID=A0A165X2Q5_9AGAM|nr:hypothetical protein SISSUDRAFT_664056 [Sistotremastrum suecicum HHB10207 ss-3]
MEQTTLHSESWEGEQDSLYTVGTMLSELQLLCLGQRQGQVRVVPIDVAANTARCQSEVIDHEKIMLRRDQGSYWRVHKRTGFLHVNCTPAKMPNTKYFQWILLILSTPLLARTLPAADANSVSGLHVLRQIHCDVRYELLIFPLDNEKMICRFL